MTTIPRRPTTRSSGETGLAFVIALLVMPFTSILYGATLAKLWEWFVADTFGVRAISTAQAIGLAIAVTYVTYQRDARKDTDEGPLTLVFTAIFVALFSAGFTLAFGAIVKAFV